MDTWNAVAVALTFVWLGMVLGISFLEAPLKFGAPGVTLQIGLGIGRRVFRALNAVEVVLAVLIAAAFVYGYPERGRNPVFALGVAGAVLVVQLALIRPALTKRSDAVLAGDTEPDGPRSRAHLWYVGAEIVKIVALAAGGVLLLLWERLAFRPCVGSSGCRCSRSWRPRQRPSPPPTRRRARPAAPARRPGCSPR